MNTQQMMAKISLIKSKATLIVAYSELSGLDDESTEEAKTLILSGISEIDKSIADFKPKRKVVRKEPVGAERQHMEEEERQQAIAELNEEEQRLADELEDELNGDRDE